MSNMLIDDPDPLDDIVTELRKYDGWEPDDVKDRQLAKAIVEGFPTLDLLAEARSWRIWMLDHPEEKKVRPRARFSNWCRNAIRFGRPSSETGSAGAKIPRSRNRARTAQEFGSTTESASRW